MKLGLRLGILARCWGVTGRKEVVSQVKARVRNQKAHNLHHSSKTTGPVLLLGHHLALYPIAVLVVRVPHLSLYFLSLTFKT